jgi:hypothetical protein
MVPMDFENLKKKICEPKVSRLLPNVCDFQKENHTLGYGFKNLKKIYGLAYGFLFCVITVPSLDLEPEHQKSWYRSIIKFINSYPEKKIFS